MSPKAGRPHWWVAGLSLSLLLVAGLLTWAVLRDGVYVAPEPDQPIRTAAPALAAGALHDLERAVRTGDPEAAGALAPPGDDQARSSLASVAENAAEARVTDFSLRYVTELGGVGQDGSWAASVDATWAFRGFDRSPARTEIQVEFAQVGDGVRVTGIGGGDRRTPVWMSGPLEVRRTPTTLVLVVGDGRLADDYAARARAAVPAVRKVLPRWRPRLVVEVPATVQGFDRALDNDPGSMDKIAATTESPDGLLSPDAPVHVFVNPLVFAHQKERGAQIVMTHEAAHIATDAANGTGPVWLVEGFADYVALRDTDLPDSVVARRIIGRVRRAGPPPHLPGSQEFDTTSPHLGAAYEASWLACRLVARRSGERSLVRLYAAVRSGEPVGHALEATAGLTTRQLTREWQGLLTDLAT